MISGIILAAGASSRLGTPKQLLELEGRPLLQHVVDAACASSLDEVVVVLGHEAVRVEAALHLPAKARVIVNNNHAAGQSTSLKVGLGATAVGSRAVLILLGDQPDMTADVIERVIDAWKRTDAAVVRARFGSVPGHPVLIARSRWPALAGVAGDRGARDVLATLEDEIEEVDIGGPPLEDVDTWEQYERRRGGGRR